MRTTANLPGGGSAATRLQTLSGLRAGEYYVVAVDDLESDDVRDPVVLDKLRSSATRVTVGEGATVEVSLRRGSFADIMRHHLHEINQHGQSELSIWQGNAVHQQQHLHLH